ncbi:LamB/YcsF family protein [Alkalihalobacillus sp. 1P02AB]|uniref:LamB/YcsF family protein n=1 Tax=Alkalihalobacillus sp. 1P02AB TaxID=3132260 RepID=UPI0039A4368F
MLIDLNSDIGESYGAFKVGQDEAIIPYVTSVNIACGYHAGDHAVMAKTVQLAAANGVAIGAHPGYPDLQGFGRRFIPMKNEEIYQAVIYQLGALQAMCKAYGTDMKHVKPHGALYNVAAVNTSVAQAIVDATFDVNPQLILYGLSGSELVKVGERSGLRVAHEVFADRTYQKNGTLTPRTDLNALIHNPEVAANRIIQLVKTGTILCHTGEEIQLKADTICVHGDHVEALLFVKKLHERLQAEGMTLKEVGAH